MATSGYVWLYDFSLLVWSDEKVSNIIHADEEERTSHGWPIVL
jgi:hypothetical protein